MKHLQIDYHFVREHVIKGDLLVKHVFSTYQFVDILTKGLSSPLFRHHCSNLMLGSSMYTIEGGCKDTFILLIGIRMFVTFFKTFQFLVCILSALNQTMLCSDLTSSVSLQFSEWLERSKQTDFTERDYACHLDCIAKVLGLWKAEKFIEKIPESFRGKLVYQTLLASCVSVLNIKKAESVFRKMRDLGLPITVEACEQMIIIYKRLEKKKIPNILLMMKDQNIKPFFGV